MKKLTSIFAAIFAISILMSCTTIKEIPEDKTAAQIIQYGQNAVTDTQYKTALYYYEEAIHRYGDNPAVYAEATYEIGHVYIKQKKYEEAYKTFTNLIALYDYNAAVLPPKHKKLAQIGLSKIPENKLEAIKAKLEKEAAQEAAKAQAQAQNEADEVKEENSEEATSEASDELLETETETETIEE